MAACVAIEAIALVAVRIRADQRPVPGRGPGPQPLAQARDTADRGLAARDPLQQLPLPFGPVTTGQADTVIVPAIGKAQPGDAGIAAEIAPLALEAMRAGRQGAAQGEDLRDHLLPAFDVAQHEMVLVTHAAGDLETLLFGEIVPKGRDLAVMDRVIMITDGDGGVQGKDGHGRPP